MNKIKITSDSTIDLSKDLIKKYDIDVLPFIVTLGDKTYLDGEDITIEDMYSHAEKTGEYPKSAARCPEDYHTFFKKYTDKGYQVVHIGIGADLSSGHGYAQIGAKGLDGVFVPDSKSLSSGSGLLAIYASELAKSGKFNAEEISEKVSNRAHNNQSSFIIEKVKYLYKGGRCSMISMLGANLLRIKPCIQVVNGVNLVARKYMGNMEQCTKRYFEDTLKIFNNPDHTRAMVCSSTATPQMLNIAKKIVKKYGKFKEVIYGNVGCVIGCHCGPNTIGILYLNDGDEGHYD